MLSDKKFLHKTFPEKKISDIMILYVQKDPYIKTFPHTGRFQIIHFWNNCYPQQIT